MKKIVDEISTIIIVFIMHLLSMDLTILSENVFVNVFLLKN